MIVRNYPGIQMCLDVRDFGCLYATRPGMLNLSYSLTMRLLSGINSLVPRAVHVGNGVGVSDFRGSNAHLPVMLPCVPWVPHLRIVMCLLGQPYTLIPVISDFFLC